MICKKIKIYDAIEGEYKIYLVKEAEGALLVVKKKAVKFGTTSS